MKIKITAEEKKELIKIYIEKIKNKRNIDIELYGVRFHNILESFGLAIDRNRKGKYNGYGYERLCNAYIFRKEDRKIWQKMYKTLVDDKIKIIKEKKELTEDQKQEKWAKRLCKLTNISFEEAKEIADEKIEYQIEQVEELHQRQCDSFSKKRASLISKIENANPLRYIKDEAHALSILRASERHNNTNYEDLLKQGREEAEMGNIEKSEVKEYAREHMCKR